LNASNEGEGAPAASESMTSSNSRVSLNGAASNATPPGDAPSMNP